MNVIAHIVSPYRDKFGVPRQAGLAGGEARVVFEPDYRVAEAVRGLEDFDYVWLIWQFHLAQRQGWSPTVRPPRLGGNRRVGVFATRSPFRPNAIGLSSVRLLRVANEPGYGPVLYVEGADLVDGTPILDVKPYIPYADSHPEARAGFAAEQPTRLHVSDPRGELSRLPEPLRQAVVDTVANDPRPHYQHDPEREYAMLYADYEVRFCVDGPVATIVKVEKKDR